MKNKQKKQMLSEKIAKIMREGVRGKKTSQAQAVAIAYSMLKKKKHG